MAFLLEVEFAGLCNYLIHPNAKQVAVLMPDGRRPVDGTPVDPYDVEYCHEHLVYHVGYLRYNLADATNHVPGNDRYGGPMYEVIHRFDFDHLDFGLDCDEDIQGAGEICVAKLEGFAQRVTIKPGIFSTSPPPELLMRTVLCGGEFSSHVLGRSRFDDTFNDDGEEYCEGFAGSVTWTRQIEEDDLTIRIRDWNGAVKRRIRLRPRGKHQVVKLKIANLCAQNPLEWREFFLRIAGDEPDKDFKWFYRLWQHPDGEFPDVLAEINKGCNATARCKQLPIPIPEPVHGDVTNCGGSRRDSEFTSPDFNDE